MEAGEDHNSGPLPGGGMTGADQGGWARPTVPPSIALGRVIAIGRGLRREEVLPVARALREAGIHAFEVTLSRPGALDQIADLAAAFEPGEMLVGAGTVMDVEAAKDALAAGARFIVSPHTDTRLVAWAAGQGLPAFPGAFTPTEIHAAWLAGAAAVKLFLASAVGAAFVREFRGPFAGIPLIPTGGVTADNAAAWIAAGALAVGVGSWLTGSGDPDVVRDRAAALVVAVGG